MTERESLTRSRISSISSDDTKTHSTLLKRLTDIFESAKRYLDRRQSRLNECIKKEELCSTSPHWTKEQVTHTSFKPILTTDDNCKSDIYESTDNTKYATFNSNDVPGLHEAHNKTLTEKLHCFDRIRPATKCYDNLKHGQPSTYTCEGGTSNACQAYPFSYETANSYSASNGRNVNPPLETNGSQSVQNADLKNDETFINIGYSGVDSTSDLDNLQNITVDRQHTSIRNCENDVHKQRSVPRKWFISLAVINIILVVFLFLLFIEQRQDKPFRNEEIKQILKEELSSLEGKISASVYCLPCDNIDETISDHFLKSDEGRCCVKDASQVLRIFFGLIDMKTKEYTPRLDILKESQTRALSDIADLQMKVFDKNYTASGWPKHPEIQKNNRLINVLLTRRRSAIQLKGVVSNGFLKWSTDMSEGKLTHKENVISLENGGMYVMYSMIRFRKNVCGSDGKIGYSIKHRSDSGPALPITSMYRDCFNERSYDHDLFIQKSFKLSVGQNTDIFLDIGNLDELIDRHNEHYFGVFEL